MMHVRNETFKNEGLVMFDGIPRTIRQAEIMQRDIPIDFVFNIASPFDITLEKLMGRRVCPVCDRNYNVCSIDRDGYFLKPMLPSKSPHHCEDCGDGKTVELVRREDDREDVIRNRMQIYYEKTDPILNVFR